ncbi:MAG TPA: UDP-3-O-[3-hydroxymyristoyl] N-acetylglucosamine deacetylase [Deltaproteobacteria bacterium]|nr:UDP-3-O-[3-hydroxymyristoyl] N-acetylglucosamine deacetylase [Deltaproteobacteria bacterium]
MKRMTIAQTLVIRGTGIHRGGDIEIVLYPSDQGIVFVKDGQSIPAIPENVVDTQLNTTIGLSGVRISTIEHLMSAFYGLGITDCTIEVRGDEIPVIDGSALPYVMHIQQAGLKKLGLEISPVVITDTIRAELRDSWVEVTPGSFSVSYEIDFDAQAIGFQRLIFDGSHYIRDIAPARTFGLLKDVEAMRSMGLAMGGGLHNAVVVDGKDVLNPEGLRFADEFVRHKMLDILGDLWILGAPIMGRIRAFKANHMLHVECVKKIDKLLGSQG